MATSPSGHVASVSEVVPPEQDPSDVRMQIRIDLMYTQLPNRSESGAIEFDPRSEAIRCRDFPPVLENLLESCHDVGKEE